MIPIFEQGSGKGIGHTFETFIQSFDLICAKHNKQGKGRSFAFIFYDFKNHELRELLKDQGVFAQLDRLSGSQLSLFYLHGGSPKVVARFNQHFLASLGINGQAKLPCVVFFRVKNDQIEGVEIVQLDSADLIHGFKELYDIIEQYLATDTILSKQDSQALVWLKGSVKFISIEIFRAALKKTFESLF